jgi:AraC family transcriptional regulator, regulatory protein of adaptative response / DNA-3-methyladenine glycosylase II
MATMTRTPRESTAGAWTIRRRRLGYRAPIDAAGLIAYLGRRAVAGVEEVEGSAYRRSLRLPRGAGVIELRPRPDHIAATLWLHDPRDAETAVKRSRVLLDLDADPDAVQAALAPDPVIGAAVRAVPGRRVPGHPDGAELAIRAVLGQQVSVAGATTLAARLVTAYGEPLAQPLGGVTHLFPSSAALAQADPAQLAIPAARRRAVLGLADALARGEITLDPDADADADADRAETERRLLALPGIGPWTVSYVAMRALGDRDAFVPTDLGVRRGLEALGHDGRPAAAAALAERWRPYRAYALQYLWAQLAAAPPEQAR